MLIKLQNQLDSGLDSKRRCRNRNVTRVTCRSVTWRTVKATQKCGFGAKSPRWGQIFRIIQVQQTIAIDVFARISCRSVHYKEMRVHCTVTKKLPPFSLPFCAHMALIDNIFTRFEFGLGIHMPVKFYLDKLRFARVICKKPILSKYILRCQAFAWQRTIRYFTASWTSLFLQSGKLQVANLLQICYFCLIQKTMSNSLFWLLVMLWVAIPTFSPVGNFCVSF